MNRVADYSRRAGAWVQDTRLRRIGYLVIALILAILCVFPTPKVARAKLLPQDANSAGLGQVLTALGGQLGNFVNLLGGGRVPNDFYLIVARSDTVQAEVVQRLKLAGEGRQYSTTDRAKIALGKKVDVRLLLGGVVEVEVKTHDAAESLALTQAYVEAIAKRIGGLAGQTLDRRRRIVENRLRDAQQRVAQTEGELDAFRRVNRLASPEQQLGTEISLRASLQGQLAAREVELRQIQEYAGPENPQLVGAQEAVAKLRAQIAQSDPPTLGAAGPNVGGLTVLSSRYLNLFRDYRFAQSLYEVYVRGSEQVAVEGLAAESATYVQMVEAAHLDPQRHYNNSAVASLIALILVIVFTELYVPLTGLKWRYLAGSVDDDV